MDSQVDHHDAQTLTPPTGPGCRGPVAKHRAIPGCRGWRRVTVSCCRILPFLESSAAPAAPLARRQRPALPLGRPARRTPGTPCRVCRSECLTQSRAARRRQPRRSIVLLLATASRPPAASLCDGFASLDPAPTRADLGACGVDGRDQASSGQIHTIGMLRRRGTKHQHQDRR